MCRIARSEILTPWITFILIIHFLCLHQGVRTHKHSSYFTSQPRTKWKEPNEKVRKSQINQSIPEVNVAFPNHPHTYTQQSLVMEQYKRGHNENCSTFTAMCISSHDWTKKEREKKIPNTNGGKNPFQKNEFLRLEHFRGAKCIFYLDSLVVVVVLDSVPVPVYSYCTSTLRSHSCLV